MFGTLISIIYLAGIGLASALHLGTTSPSIERRQCQFSVRSRTTIIQAKVDRQEEAYIPLIYKLDRLDEVEEFLSR
jgi:hypothetical protein